MSKTHVDLLGRAGAQTLTKAAPALDWVELPGPPTQAWFLQINIEGTAGDAEDACIPVLQTTLDNGTTALDVASGASVAGGEVAAANDFIHCPAGATAPARKAPSDKALAASTINLTLLGNKVRLAGAVTDADDDAAWQINKAILYRVG
ncbi:MAG: hypothetical protein ACO1SX_13820 [Actinomycetota bacterium]